MFWVTRWSGGLGLASALKIYVQTSCLHVSPACDRTGDPDETLSRPREVQMGNAAAWTQILNMLFAFFPSPGDKESCSLLGKATFPLSQEQRCKAQPCKATPPLSGSWAIFYIYQLSKESAGLAVCWQRQSAPFLYSTSPWMFTGTQHKRHSPVICLQSDFKDL